MDVFVFIHDTIVPLGIFVLLPVMVVRMIILKKTHEDDMRKEIILAALEKNGNIDVEELVKKMNTPNKLLKEKLLSKLQWGMLAFFVGTGSIGFGIYLVVAEISAKETPLLISLGLVLVAVGIAFLANYHIGKKMLAKEMEEEEQNVCQS